MACYRNRVGPPWGHILGCGQRARSPHTDVRESANQGQSKGHVAVFSPQKPPSQKKLPQTQNPRQSSWQLAAFSPTEVSQKPSPQSSPETQSLGQENSSSKASQKRLPQMPIWAQSCWQLMGLSQLGLQKKSPQVQASPQSSGHENWSSKQLSKSQTPSPQVQPPQSNGQVLIVSPQNGSQTKSKHWQKQSFEQVPMFSPQLGSQKKSPQKQPLKQSCGQVVWSSPQLAWH